MSTNANASNGASKKTSNSEMVVKKVSDAEIIEDMKKYTGNPDTVLTADCIIYDVGERNRVDSEAPAGSNVNVSSTGKQTTVELENGNSVTLVAKDAATLNRAAGKSTDRKTASKKRTDRESTEQQTDENNR